MNLKLLARELNLSISTVSKALRDSHEISSKTKLAVQAKAKQLNYQPNPFASSLRKQKSKTIAVVVPDVANNFFALAINGIESIAQEKGYNVLIFLTHEDPQKEIAITRLLQNGRVDGIMISLSGETSDISHLRELIEKEIPLVFFDRVADQIKSPKITTDDYNCGKKATQHLIENGCKKIAFLSIYEKLSTTNKRSSGYLDALKDNGIKQNSKLMLSFNGDEEKINDLTRKLLKSKNRPDGIFASVERLALSCYEICGELSIKIPEDIKIISFSNMPMAALLNPSLSTITQPAFEIGREAADILFKLVEKRGHNFLLEKTILKSHLVERHSTWGNLKPKTKVEKVRNS